MTTTVTYHHGEDGVARPAINVKDHNSGDDYREAMQRLVNHPVADDILGIDDEYGKPISIHSMAYEQVRSDFWQTAEQVAAERGLGEIAQEGRSGGWLVFTDGRDPQDDGDWIEDCTAEQYGRKCRTLHSSRKEWLAAYRAMVEWADAYIADAPQKVAALAQQWAMDEAGEAAALRMFAFGRAA